MARTTRFTVIDCFQLTWKTRWKTQKSARDQWRNGNDAVDFFGKTKALDKITTPDLIEYQQYLIKRATGRTGVLRPGTINKKVQAMMTMLTVAARAGHIGQVPLSPEHLQENNQKDRVISRAEEDLFLKFFEKTQHHEEADLLVVMIDTLARWSDIERCICRHVDLERKEITYNHRKNKMISTLPLTDRAVQALYRLTAGKKPADHIYGASYWTFLAAWEKALAWMGLENDAAMTPHCTRHTGASRLAAKGMSLPKIQGMGGWSSLKSVQRYMHFDTSALTECVAALQS